MSKQYTVITKDGSKWLERVPDVPVFGDESGWMEQVLEEDMPYLGSRPEGTVLDESEVREVLQWRKEGDYGMSDWVSTWDRLAWEAELKSLGAETRTAYVDAEPDYDAEDHIHKHEWPSTKYVAREIEGESGRTKELMPLVKLCADEMREVEYWKRRCESAEKLIGMEPSDPKTYDEFCRLREEWDKIVKQESK